VRGKAKDKIDNNCQDSGTDDARDRKIDVNCDCSKVAREAKVMTQYNTNDDGGLRLRLCLDFKNQFHLLQTNGKKNCKRG
jgi:hypothetical protein